MQGLLPWPTSPTSLTSTGKRSIAWNRPCCSALLAAASPSVYSAQRPTISAERFRCGRYRHTGVRRGGSQPLLRSCRSDYAERNAGQFRCPLLGAKRTWAGKFCCDAQRRRWLLRATALVAIVAEPKTFRSGRNFSAWIGLVPKQRSSGGRDRLGSISKQGDRYLRGLFVAGAFAVIRYAKI